MEGSKRKVDSKAKKPAAKRATEIKKPFGVVWTDGVQRFPVCFCSSHEDGQIKAQALRDEYDDFLAAGGNLRGDEHNLYFFHTTMDGLAWHLVNGKPERPVYTDKPGQPFYTLKEEKIGKEAFLKEEVPDDDIDLLVHEATSSMAFTATKCSTSEVYAAFWRKMRARPYSLIETLRRIYTAGDYDKIPTEDEIKKREEEND